MKVKKIRINIKYLFEKYYVLLHIGYLNFVFVPSIRIGVVASIMTLIVLLLALPIRVQNSRNNVLLLSLMIYATISVFFLDFSNQSMSVVASKYMASIFPMVFFYLGQAKPKAYGRFKDFYFYFRIAMLICFTVGLYWYITEPTYFIEYMIRTDAGFMYSSYLTNRRFWSYVGSIGTGLLSVCGLIVFLNNYLLNKKKFDLIGIFCMIGMSVLSMQRSSYVMMVFFFAWIVLRQKNHNFKNALSLCVLMSVVFIIASLIIPNFQTEVTTQVTSRIDQINFSSMFSRAEKWMQVFEMGPQIIIGRGIGSFTQGAKHTINDGLFFNIIGELGIIGLLLELAVIIGSFAKSNRTHGKRANIIEKMIVIAFLINGIGSNGMLYMDMAPLFWYSVGRLNSIYSQ